MCGKDNLGDRNVNLEKIYVCINSSNTFICCIYPTKNIKMTTNISYKCKYGYIHI